MEPLLPGKSTIAITKLPTAPGSLFFGQATNRHDGKENERRLNELLYNPLDRWTKLRASAILFPMSLLMLLPAVIVHTNAHRFRYLVNGTEQKAGTNFYGFPVLDGMVPYSVNPAMYFILWLNCHIVFSKGCRYERNNLFFSTIFGIFCLSYSVPFPSLSANNNYAETLKALYFMPRASLAMAHALLLTLLQEHFPRKSRAFATALYCAADATVNCLSYFCVHYFYQNEFVYVAGTRFFDWNTYYEICVCTSIGLVMMYCYNHKFPHPPYLFVNYSEEYRTVHGDEGEKAMLWKTREAASFKRVWGVNRENISQGTLDRLKEKCLAPFGCKECDHSEQNSCRILFLQTFPTQLACCILQLPLLMVLGNAESLFVQFGYTWDYAVSCKETLHIVYTASAILALFVVELITVKKAVVYSGFLTFLTIFALSVGGSLTNVNFLYADWLFGTTIVLCIVNGLLLVPASWTIIGDSCGRNRIQMLVYIILINGLMTLLCQKVLEHYGWSLLCTFSMPIYAAALAYFSRTYKEEWNEEATKIIPFIISKIEITNYLQCLWYFMRVRCVLFIFIPMFFFFEAYRKQSERYHMKEHQKKE